MRVLYVLRAAEHCPVCILQARGGGAIPGFALSTIERFVAVTSIPAVELPRLHPCTCACRHVEYWGAHIQHAHAQRTIYYPP